MPSPGPGSSGEEKVTENGVKRKKKTGERSETSGGLGRGKDRPLWQIGG